MPSGSMHEVDAQETVLVLVMKFNILVEYIVLAASTSLGFLGQFWLLISHSSDSRRDLHGVLSNDDSNIQPGASPTRWIKMGPKKPLNLMVTKLCVP